MNYFISFSHKNGFGNAMLTLKNKIKDMEDIRGIQEYIETQKGAQNVIVLSFKLMEE